jgi:protein adenylyltransferase
MLHVESGATDAVPQQERDRIACFDNSFARLPERFFARVGPTPVAAPRLIRFNGRLRITGRIW